MADFIWTNSYPAEQVAGILTALVDMDDVGFLFYCNEGRCIVVADTPLAPSVDGREPGTIADEHADEVFKRAVDQDAAFCGCWLTDRSRSRGCVTGAVHFVAWSEFVRRRKIGELATTFARHHKAFHRSWPRLRPTMEKRPLVLVVEDNRLARVSAEKTLAKAGFLVRTASHGQEAVDLLSTELSRPAVILLDMMMPVLDGWEFLEELPKLNLKPQPSIVVTTGSSAIGPEWAADHGCRGLLQKPFDEGGLLSEVRRCLDPTFE